MTQVTFSIRMDKKLKKDFSELCEKLGLNMSVAMNMFAKKAVNEKRIPFDISLEQIEQTSIEKRIEQLSIEDAIIRKRGIDAFNNLRKQAKENSLNELSLEDINNEIKTYRESKQ